MKKTKIFILPLFLLFLLSACSSNSSTTVDDKAGTAEASLLQVDDEGNTKINDTALQNFLNQPKTEDLSSVEAEGLRFMMEEEKLARDVYKTLYDKWNQQSFNNISQSEATHIGAVRSLAEKYDIDLSFYNDTVGEFNDEKLLGLYKDLVAQGETSLLEALRVGALIEEIDIIDLDRYIPQTDKQDISLVYENLKMGSRNHLRSFARNITRQGEKYVPQRLDVQDYEEIINTANEQGVGGSRGRQGSGAQGGGQGGNRK